MSRLRYKFSMYVLMSLMVLVILGPLLYALSMSFMNSNDFNMGRLLPSSLSLENYRKAFLSFPLAKFLFNTFVMASLVTIGQLLTSSMAAFAFTFIQFRGRQFLFFVVISTMMIPWEATIIVNYQTVMDLGWLNSFAGLSLPYFAAAFGIFLLRQSFMTLPDDLYEAAQIDGCSRFRFFTRIVLPLSKPMLATLAIHTFLTTWNKYLWPLLVTNTDKVRTVQIGLKMMQSEEQTNWPVVMAAVILVVLPTLLLLFFGHKQLQKGLTSGALKG